MRIFSITLILCLSNFISRSQSLVNFRFYDSCRDTVLTLKYNLRLLEDSFFWATDTILRFDKGGLYMLTAYEYRQAGNYKAFYNFTKMLELGTEYLDTLTLPKSTVWFESELHTGYANRFESELYAKKAKWHCCEELCQGEIVEYYSTGEKRLEGKFKDGLPMGKIIYYDKKGNIGKIAKYRKGYLRNIIYPNLQAWLNITEDSKL